MGKYQGNDRNIKYIVGDCVSQYLSKNCKLEKVFGSIIINNYIGDFDICGLQATNRFEVASQQSVGLNINSFCNALGLLSIENINNL